MIYYIDEDNERHNVLPGKWKGLSPFNETIAQSIGWQKIEEPDSTEERDDAERYIVQKIAELADKYSAREALTNLEDISIPTLLQLADEYHVTAEDLQSLEVQVLILARHLEAVTGFTWSETWDGLKSRFRSYLEQILNAE